MFFNGKGKDMDERNSNVFILTLKFLDHLILKLIIKFLDLLILKLIIQV